MARSVEDVIMFDDIFSECNANSSRQEIQLNGTRLGYPINYWEDLDPKVCFLPLWCPSGLFVLQGCKPVE